MSGLILERYCYSDIATLGKLYLSHNEADFLYTLERPWIGGVPGGMPFESCVPDGRYELLPYTRQNGDEVYALRNPDNGVYFTKAEKGSAPGRYKILIHAANYVDQIAGCVAPGRGKAIHQNKHMVTHSRDAMREIMEYDWPYIEIKPATGTKP